MQQNQKAFLKLKLFFLLNRAPPELLQGVPVAPFKGGPPIGVRPARRHGVRYHFVVSTEVPEGGGERGPSDGATHAVRELG